MDRDEFGEVQVSPVTKRRMCGWWRYAPGLTGSAPLKRYTIVSSSDSAVIWGGSRELTSAFAKTSDVLPEPGRRSLRVSGKQSMVTIGEVSTRAATGAACAHAPGTPVNTEVLVQFKIIAMCVDTTHTN